MTASCSLAPSACLYFSLSKKGLFVVERGWYTPGNAADDVVAEGV